MASPLQSVVIGTTPAISESQTEVVAMSHTHEYDCIVCGAHLDSSEQLSHHNQELHLRTATGMERPRRDRGKEREERNKREDPLPDREL